jgi:superfamily II DNA/RNA helicase
MEINEKIKEILENLDISALNEMQEEAFHAIKEESEVILLSPTGSGKSLGFLLPIFDLLILNKKEIQVLILTPTRELAIQLEKVWQKMKTGFKVNACYGGHTMSVEMQNLSQPPALLIGTPGRILDHMNRKSFDQRKVNVLILDEFDKSLAMGFQEQMDQIIKSLTGLKKRVLVSATPKLQIPPFVGVNTPVTLLFSAIGEKTTEGLQLKVLYSRTADKFDLLFHLLCFLGSSSTIIFCNLRGTADEVSARLSKKGITNACFHGGMTQIDREKTLITFRNGSIIFLVSSDLAARGLDIPEVKNIIHFEIPSKNTDFIHRNGRTARMHAAGNAFLLIGKNEKLPSYLSTPPETFEVPEIVSLPAPSPWITLYISGGKKDRISKTDIIGFLIKKGGLDFPDIGKIEGMDFMSFVAVKKNKVESLLANVKNEKLKGKKYQIKLAG